MMPLLSKKLDWTKTKLKSLMTGHHSSSSRLYDRAASSCATISYSPSTKLCDVSARQLLTPWRDGIEDRNLRLEQPITAHNRGADDCAQMQREIGPLLQNLVGRGYGAALKKCLRQVQTELQTNHTVASATLQNLLYFIQCAQFEMKLDLGANPKSGSRKAYYRHQAPIWRCRQLAAQLQRKGLVESGHHSGSSLDLKKTAEIRVLKKKIHGEIMGVARTPEQKQLLKALRAHTKATLTYWRNGSRHKRDRLVEADLTLLQEIETFSRFALPNRALNFDKKTDRKIRYWLLQLRSRLKAVDPYAELAKFDHAYRRSAQAAADQAQLRLVRLVNVKTSSAQRKIRKHRKERLRTSLKPCVLYKTGQRLERGLRPRPIPENTRAQ